MNLYLNFHNNKIFENLIYYILYDLFIKNLIKKFKFIFN